MSDENQVSTAPAQAAADVSTEGSTPNAVDVAPDTGVQGDIAQEQTDAAAVASADAAQKDSETAANAEGEGGEKTEASEDYQEFKLPEDTTLDAKTLESATPLMKEMGLNQEQAQKMVDWYAEQVAAQTQKQWDDFNSLTDEWLQQAKNDNEIGGDKFDENVSIALEAVNKFGSEPLKQLLEDYGLGNHPEVIRLMVNVGKLTREDVPHADGATPANRATDRVQRLYPND